MNPFVDPDLVHDERPTLSSSEKAAAVLLAMGKPVAGKLLKFFQHEELQIIIKKAQALRTIPPNELIGLVNEFEDLFSEGAGLMDNAKAMESILEEGLTPDEVDGLLGRRAQFQSVSTTVWEQLQDAEPAMVSTFLENEHPQTAAYIVSMLPSAFAGKILMKLPDKTRIDIVHRAVNLKQVNPRAAEIIEKRIEDLVTKVEAEKSNAGMAKVAEIMNELSKPEVETLLGELEAVSKTDVAKVRPRVFLFDDIRSMPARSRATLFNDISGDVLTLALHGIDAELQEAILSSIGQRQRRMIESDLSAGDAGINPREIAIARRTIAQEAIRLAAQDQIKLREENSGESQAEAA